MRKKRISTNQKTLTTPEQKHTSTTIITDSVTQFFCPFCLHFDYFFRFEVELKSGKKSKRYQCPDCSKKMLKETLTKEFSPEDYAEWVFEYSHYGFWKKINFNEWKERLYQLGISKQFWDKYRSLKSSMTGEYINSNDEESDYQDYIKSLKDKGY